MKKQNENNPVVIGSLLVVLAGAVVVVFRSFVPQDDLVFTPAPAAAAAPAVAPPDLGTLTLTRDPFFHPDIQRIAAAGEKLEAPVGVSAADGGAFPASDGFDNSLSLNGGGNAPINPMLKTPAKSPVKTNPTASTKRPALPDPAAAANDFAQHLRLTAVLGGGRPRAIVEGGTSQPVVVSVGDPIGVLQVVAIRAQEIVLSGAGGLWTIPLQSAAPTETTAPPPADLPAPSDKEPKL